MSLPQRPDIRWLVTILSWLANFCDGAARIVIPLYFASLGIAAHSIGIMFFFYELSGFVTNLLSGFLLNRIGYKRGFLMALACHTLASFLYLALHSSMEFLVLMVIISCARALRGVGKELVKTTGGAYIKSLGHSGQQYLFAQILLGGKDVSKGIGILVGGALLGLIAFDYILLMLGCLTLVSLLLAARLLADHREEIRVSFKGFFAVKRKLKILAWARAMLYGSRDAWLAVPLPLYLAERGVPPLKIAALLAVGLMAFGVLQPLLAPLIHRGIHVFGKAITHKIRYRDILWPTSALTALTTAALVWIPEGWLHDLWVISGVIAYHVLAAVATVPHNHLHLKYAQPGRGAVDIAYYKSIGQVGKLAAVGVSGYIYLWQGLPGCMVFACAFLVAATLLGRRLTKVPKGGLAS